MEALLIKRLMAKLIRISSNFKKSLVILSSTRNILFVFYLIFSLFIFPYFFKDMLASLFLSSIFQNFMFLY